MACDRLFQVVRIILMGQQWEPGDTNRDIRNYLMTKIQGVPRCERLTREKFSNWLAQQS